MTCLPLDVAAETWVLRWADRSARERRVQRGAQIRARDGLAVAGPAVVKLASIDEPPFSIEERLEDKSLLNRTAGKKLEVRLLAIDPAHRNQMVFAELLGAVIELALREGFEVLVISGIVQQAAVYRKFGFQDLGPPVASGRADYIPMLLRIPELPQRIWKDIERWRRRKIG